jgi:hypothetical protein
MTFGERHIVAEKKCSQCLEIKELDLFPKSKLFKDAHHSFCKACKKKSEQKRRERPEIKKRTNEIQSRSYYRRKEINKMTNKFKDIYSDLAPNYKKVYDVVPNSEPWNIQQIVREITRSTGVNLTINIVQIGLNTMVSNGLIVETKRGLFCRSKEIYGDTMQIKKEEKTNNIFNDLFALISDITTKVSHLKTSAELAYIEFEEQLKDKTSISEDEKKMIELQRQMSALSQKMSK